MASGSRTDTRRSGVLALVIARGGSKGIPAKNLQLLDGHPLVAWAVAAGVHCTTVDRTLCSTDSEDIADVARRYGAEVPFLRPPQLAADDTPDLPVFQHALSWLAQEEGWSPEIVVHLRPTTPLRPPSLVDESVKLLVSTPAASSVRSVVESPVTPYKMWRPPPKGGTSPFLRPLLSEHLEHLSDEPYNSPRQALPPVWLQTGTIDTVRATVIEDGSMTGPAIMPLVIEPEYAVDIDHLAELKAAQSSVLMLNCVRPGPAIDWSEIRLLALDVDGTLTPGDMFVGPDGEVMKRFHTHDGRGLEMVRDCGVEVAIITQEATSFAVVRAQKLGIDRIHVGVRDKTAKLQEICDSLGLSFRSVAYVGDDVGDVPVMTAVNQGGGISCAVGDARPEVLKVARYVTANKGGYGAVRDVSDQICTS